MRPEKLFTIPEIFGNIRPWAAELHGVSVQGGQEAVPHPQHPQRVWPREGLDPVSRRLQT